MSARAKSSPHKGEQLLLEFGDNKLVAVLSGPLQKHFARLEQRLSILITQRGNLIAHPLLLHHYTVAAHQPPHHH